MKALTDRQVGGYLNEHFAAAFQKVGTFKIVNGSKVGGNVATYFCTADGRVIHAIAGPVDAATLLREAKWARETWEKSRQAAAEDAAKYLSRAHADRRSDDRAGRTTQAAVHLLLTSHVLHNIDHVYIHVWERILKETLSVEPVTFQGR